MAACRGFVLLPRRWVVERSFARMARFRRLAYDDERLPETVAGLHFVAFACLMLVRMVEVFAQVHNTLSVWEPRPLPIQRVAMLPHTFAR